MGNSSQKKLNAFYHNQQIEYDEWLKRNAAGQRRQVCGMNKASSLVLASVLAMSSGFVVAGRH